MPCVCIHAISDKEHNEQRKYRHLAGVCVQPLKVEIRKLNITTHPSQSGCGVVKQTWSQKLKIGNYGQQSKEERGHFWKRKFGFVWIFCSAKINYHTIWSHRQLDNRTTWRHGGRSESILFLHSPRSTHLEIKFASNGDAAHFAFVSEDRIVFVIQQNAHRIKNCQVLSRRTQTIPIVTVSSILFDGTTLLRRTSEVAAG